VKKSLLSVSVLVASSYLLLSVASTACAIDFGDRHAAGHHHGGSLFHSDFCAWTCQAAPTSGLISAEPPGEPRFAVVTLYLQQEADTPYRFGDFSVSRGPPSLPIQS
jgi:hypothetical protein